MKLYFPAYYNTFSCIAAACPDSCCKDWIVDVDPDAAAHYRALGGDLGDHLRAVLQDTENGTVMEIANGRCPMWQQDGLCRIQAELGHDALCKTCREFPRLRHDYGNFTDLDLELSCPEAARLILNSDDSPCVQEAPGGESPDYDADAMTVLLRSRETVLTLLGNNSRSPAEALAILLLYAHDVQAEIDGFEPLPFEPDDILQRAKKYAASGDIDSIFALFRGLDILTQRWSSLLESVPKHIALKDRTLALARYFVRRYWLQSVSDLDLICRVKFIITACLMINAVGCDFVDIAHLFSKEIENNTDNVDAILDNAYTSPALTDCNLLGILLGC